MLNNYDMKYIIRKVIIFFIIFFILSCFKVAKAKTYNVSNNGSTVDLYLPSGTQSINFGQLYTTQSGQGMTQVYFKLDTGLVDDGYGGQIQSTLYAGSYLFDYYVSSNNLDENLSSCKDLNTDFRFIDLTTGNTISSASSIKSQCVNSFYTYLEGTPAIHYLIKFTITNTQSYDYMTQRLLFINNLWHGMGFIQAGANYNITIGNVYDFDSEIVTSFNNVADNKKIIDQNDIIINQNNATNGKLDRQYAETEYSNRLNEQQLQQQQQTNDILNSDNVDGANSQVDSLLSNSAFNDNSGIQSIINAPLSFIQGLTNTCSPISLTIPYINSNVTIPCMKQELTNHVPTIIPVLSTAINGFVIYRILIDIVYIIKSAKNPDDDRIEVLDL